MNGHTHAWKGVAFAILLLAVAALIIAYVLERPVTTTDRSEEASALVIEFGTHLKDVPLLADQETLAASMGSAYGAFVSPQLLASWNADPSSAPGRLVSSPWPERIEVSSVTKNEEGAYELETVVIEVAQGAGGLEEVSRYPARITVSEIAGALKISAFQKGDYAVVPPRMVVEGEYVCLPHRDTSGPQTLECAFGLKTDDGLHYALDFRLMSSTTWMDIGTGTRIRVEGPFIPASSLPGRQGEIYAIEGAISATSLTPLP